MAREKMPAGLPRGARPVPGFPGYFVTLDGRVLSTRPWRGCAFREMKLCLCRGYLEVDLYDGRGVRRHIRVNRLVLMVHVGPPPTLHHQAAHLDDCRTNNSVDNLEWQTPSQNTPHGGRNGRTRHTDAQVIKAWGLRHSGLSRVEAARRANVKPKLFVGLDTGKGWAHLNLGPAWPPAPAKLNRAA